jgi:hypothetical protein
LLRNDYTNFYPLKKHKVNTLASDWKALSIGVSTQTARELALSAVGGWLGLLGLLGIVTNLGGDWIPRRDKSATHWAWIEFRRSLWYFF